MATSTLGRLFTRLSLASPVPPSISQAAPLSTKAATSALIAPATQWSWRHQHDPHQQQQPQQARPLHTTPAARAKSAAPAKGSKKKGRKGKGKGGEGPDPRIVNLKSSMPRAVPAPLRFARNRALRHWTIHRAWLLYQRKERERRDRELERMYQSMRNACEELRTTSGPGTHDEGYLYRVAMEKRGLYGHNAVPIEYARPQTETPARQPWNHDWKR